MSIQFPPKRGEILIGDFSGLLPNEMSKVRPCIVLSPPFSSRSKLATVVCLSTTDPIIIMDFHAKLEFNPPYSPKFSERYMWIKGDMIYSVSLDRLTRPHIKNYEGKREYPIRILSDQDMRLVMKCVLCGIGYKVDKDLNKL